MSHLKYLANDEEINSFDQALQDYQGLRMDVDRFTATRLQMGIYGQRQEGVNMVRIKLPGGRLNAPQLNVIADMLENMRTMMSCILLPVKISRCTMCRWSIRRRYSAIWPQPD